MSTLTSTRLAIAGGEPLYATPLVPPLWPPVDETTARRLGEVYLSRRWGWNGPIEQEFTRGFAAFHDAKYGIFMANGTVTLQCALGVHGVGPGDEVIVPALTWLATAMAVHYVGATPVFVDVEPTTLCLDAQQMEAAITSRTRAVIPVHLYGGMADIEAILKIAKRHNLIVIEDCAHGQGGKWDGRGVGSWGHVGSFSFQQSKSMSSGEGGICLTNDEQTAERLYRMKHIGYAPESSQGIAESGPPEGLTCHNFRGLEFQSLILQSQLENLDQLITTYNRNAALLQERLARVPGLRVQSHGRLAGPQNYYGFCIIFDADPLVDLPLSCIQQAIQAEGFLHINRTYGSVYRHSLWNLPRAKYRIAEGGCPVADEIGTERALYFSHAWLGTNATIIEFIGNAIAKVADNAHELAGK